MYPNIINGDKLPIILTKVRIFFDIHPKKSSWYKIIAQIKLLSWLIIGKEITPITFHVKSTWDPICRYVTCIKKNSFTYCETHKTMNTRNIYEAQEN